MNGSRGDRATRAALLRRRPALTMPSAPNTNRDMHRALTLFSALIFGISPGCQKKEAPAPERTLKVTVTPIVQQDVMVMNTWVGLLNGYQNADIRAQVTGYLTTQDYKEGSSLKKGDVLFTIDKRPFEAALAQAQADYAKAVAAAQLAQITLGRQTRLYEPRSSASRNTTRPIKTPRRRSLPWPPRRPMCKLRRSI